MSLLYLVSDLLGEVAGFGKMVSSRGIAVSTRVGGIDLKALGEVVSEN